MKTIKKALALDIPQTDAEADALLAEYSRIESAVATAEATMNEALAAAKIIHENAARPFLERRRQIYDALNAFAGAHRSRLTDEGKTKTVKFPAGEFGWRTAPPSVRLKRGFEWDDVVDFAKRHANLRRFLRTKTELNREAVLADPEAAGRIEGLSVGSRGEQFFVTPFGADLSEPKQERAA
jgi:phage host-nuclease inhibitor protein Gam